MGATLRTPTTPAATLTVGDRLSVTSYQYDNANQLLTAQAENMEWRYVYDANGSLREVLPNGHAASGAKRYTYNAAGYLVRVESHDGLGWSVQAEMSYNGLGTRMATRALGITTQYASDGQMPLALRAGDTTTTVLYGLGPVAEKTADRNYALSDGLNIPRQLTDMDGKTTLAVRYDPWGKPIESEGLGNFDAGYIGTWMDATTGLIYPDNGQYYDPATGRFLIARHARAGTVWVRFDLTAGVRLALRDDGLGFDPADLPRLEREGHLGLRQMRERLEALGGRLEVRSRPGEGTEVVVEV